jgi:hypothetical protein
MPGNESMSRILQVCNSSFTVPPSCPFVLSMIEFTAQEAEMTQLNQPQQAMLIWPVLALAARMQRVLTYGDIQGLTGIAAQGRVRLWG